MKQIKHTSLPIVLLLLATMSSCDFIAGVFKGGVYVGVFLVIIVIAIIIWLVTRMGK